jgi:hypothetical protein
MTVRAWLIALACAWAACGSDPTPTVRTIPSAPSPSNSADTATGQAAPIPLGHYTRVDDAGASVPPCAQFQFESLTLSANGTWQGVLAPCTGADGAQVTPSDMPEGRYQFNLNQLRLTNGGPGADSQVSFGTFLFKVEPQGALQIRIEGTSVDQAYTLVHN